MLDIDGEFIMGLCLGIEHIDCSEEDVGIDWIIVVNLFIWRLCITKVRDE